MNQNLINLEMPYAPTAYLDIGFRNVIEDHLLILNSHPKTVEIAVTPMQLYKFDFDLVRLFRELGIRPELHWIVMRMNDISSMRDVSDKIMSIKVPELSVVSRILQTYRAAIKIN